MDILNDKWLLIQELGANTCKKKNKSMKENVLSHTNKMTIINLESWNCHLQNRTRLCMTESKQSSQNDQLNQIVEQESD